VLLGSNAVLGGWPRASAAVLLVMQALPLAHDALEPRRLHFNYRRAFMRCNLVFLSPFLPAPFSRFCAAVRRKIAVDEAGVRPSSDTLFLRA